MVSYVAQALGIMFTSFLDFKVSSKNVKLFFFVFCFLIFISFLQFSMMIGTFLLLPFFLYTNSSVFPSHTHAMLRPLFELNFFNEAVKANVNSALGLNRTKLPCEEIYCHFADPKKFLSYYELEVDLMQVFYLLLTYYLVCQTAAFILIGVRLKYRF